jgi:hypothetical protein
MKKILLQIFIFAVVTNFAACIAWADTTNIQTVPFKVQTGTGTGCPGTYTGYAIMTNSTGISWITPPINTSTGTLTDISGFAPPYSSVAFVIRHSDGQSFCNTNSVVFPATNSNFYELVAYVKSTAFTNGAPVTLQIVWH